jgi:hypothetical protein
MIYLEDALREVGNVDPAMGLSGDRLVTPRTSFTW